jgi:hypothetical protein
MASPCAGGALAGRPHCLARAQGACFGADQAASALSDAAGLSHPVVLLLPIKFIGLWMLARGYWLGAMATLGAAKVVSMGFTAFIFDVTRPKLLQLPWFCRLYEWVLK